MANMVVETLTYMYKLAKGWDMVPEDHVDPCRSIPMNPKRKRERFLTDAEFTRLGQVLDEVFGQWQSGIGRGDHDNLPADADGLKPASRAIFLPSRQLARSTTFDPRDERIFFAILSATEPVVCFRWYPVGNAISDRFRPGRGRVMTTDP